MSCKSCGPTPLNRILRAMRRYDPPEIDPVSYARAEVCAACPHNEGQYCVKSFKYIPRAILYSEGCPLDKW